MKRLATHKNKKPTKDIIYKDELITVLNTGWFEIYDIDKERFVKYDTLNGAKRRIDEMFN